MRQPIIAGNWKMNTTLDEAKQLVQALRSALRDVSDTDVVLCPPSLSLAAVSEGVSGTSLAVGAQNLHAAESGAYTGELSGAMLRSVGCDYVIIGHSERREYAGETDADVNQKIQAALRHQLTPIVCVGETLDQRQSGQEEAVVATQVRGALQGLSESFTSGQHELVIAYEPVWAIGTGQVATPEQAQSMHAAIRRLLAEVLDEATAQRTRLQYGGSVKPGNASELFVQTDIDGALVGGASLKAEDFAAIVAAYAPEHVDS